MPTDVHRGSVGGSWLQRLRLSRQLALLVLITALPLMLAMLLMFSQLAANERQGIRQSLMVRTKTLAALVDNEIDTHAAVASTLAQSRQLLDGDFPGFLEQANKALEFIPGSWLAVTRADGQMVLNTLMPIGVPLPRHVAPDIAQRALATRRPIVSDLVFGPVSNRFTAFIEVPVFLNDEARYTISITLPPAIFLKLIQSNNMEGELVAVLDGTHRFIARIPDHDARVGTQAAEGWRQSIAKTPEAWVESRTLEQELALTAYTTTTYGWIVGISQLESAISKPLQGILFAIAVIAASLTLASLGFGLLLARYASRGMDALSTAARDVGEGRVVQAPVPPFAEAAVIGESLAMASVELARRAEVIAQSTATLEGRVAERTTALAEEMRRRQQTEEQLRQMQKMDAIGQLSGGIAHDFNNMLAVVLGSLRLLERRLERGDRDVNQFTDGIRQGAERAVVLTQRLLAFARQQPLSPEPADANKLIGGMSELLRRTIRENIDIETVLAGGLWRIHADKNQLENALLNLVTNARDAMQDGGKLTIETSNAHLDELYVNAHPEISPGQYVLIAVSDTGGGMKSDVEEKAFEPFFTTKRPGQGTGLGLAQVYGFIKQSGGHVKLYNELGHGVTVKLYLPRFSGTIDETKQVPSRVPLPLAREPALILVVEDDLAVMGLTVGMLRELGYRTLEAATPLQALDLLETNPEIRILLTDVVMPVMNGRKLAEAALSSRPDIKVLYVTGYTRNAVVHNGIVDADVNLMSKPFTLELLAQKVDRLLYPSAT